jgi:serine protease Do
VVTASREVPTPAPGAALRVRWHQHDYPARLRRIDTKADVAVLELDSEAPMPGLALAAAGHEARVGQWILVIGCPFGAVPTTTVGIVSAPPGAVLEPEMLAGLIQLNAAVNAGNSGGPVVDLHGRVVAVASAAIPGASGLGFAAPAADLAALLRP